MDLFFEVNTEMRVFYYFWIWGILGMLLFYLFRNKIKD